jgi:hypothetical protein
MRGLEEIIASNADPEAYHRGREPQHGRHVESTDTNRSFESNLADMRRRNQAFHGERVEARQQQNDGGRPQVSKGDIFVAGVLADLALDAIIENIFAPPPPRPRAPRPHVGMEGIHSAIDAEPPFLKFWAKLNAKNENDGLPEVFYKEAKEAFLGGPTPLGAMTFVGKDWDGVRAVPSKPVEQLGGIRPAYQGEYRTVTADDGTVWRKVTDRNDLPIAYGLPEAALIAAKARRDFVAKVNH